jgi:hypothetical protein
MNETAPNTARELRFTYGPMWELSSSYHVLVNPTFHPYFRGWVQDALQALHDVELPYLDALVGGNGYIPDFLTPISAAEQFSQFSIEDELSGCGLCRTKSCATMYYC